MTESFNVRIEDDQLQRALNRVLKATGDLTPAMKAIGEHLLRSTEDNFRHEREPDGTPWKPLKVLSYHLGYKLRKKKATHTQSGSLTAAFSRYLAGRKILTDSHELRNSIYYNAGRTSVAIGSGKVYAAIHQFGGKAGRGKKVTIPARPFLGIGSGDRKEILATIADHLKIALNG
ncbi:MAG: phage virion morphogenesis protein [Desulfuromusa sp.]|nr:phage virion morphogenesis protein [Desulfuromusa sp.]